VARRRDLERLETEIHELFTDLWQLPRLVSAEQGFRPPVDCFSTETPPTLVVVVDLAGVDPARVRVVATDGLLVIEGERGRSLPPGRVSFQQMEIDHGPFSRRIPIGDDVDTDAASAHYRDGLLTVILPVRARPPRAGKVAIPVELRGG